MADQPVDMSTGIEPATGGPVDMSRPAPSAQQTTPGGMPINPQPAQPPDFSNASIVEKFAAMTDPAMVPPAVRALGYPDLPRYARELGAGAIEGATAGFVQMPHESDETLPSYILRTAGQVAGSLLPFTGAMKAATALAPAHPLAKVIAGAALGAAESAHQQDASVGDLILGATLGGIAAKFYHLPTLDNVEKESTAVVKEIGQKWQPRRVIVNESDTSSLLRQAQETVTTGKVKPRELFVSMTRHPDPDMREAGKTLKTFWDAIPPGEVDLQGILKTYQDSLDGVVKPLQVAAQLGKDTFEVGNKAIGKTVLVGNKSYELGTAVTQSTPTGVYADAMIRPAEFVFADVQMKSGGRIPAYTETFQPLIAGRKAAQDEIAKIGHDVLSTLKGTPLPRRQAMTQLLYAPAGTEEAIITQAGLTSSEINKVGIIKEKLRPLWERAFPNEIDTFDTYLSHVLPDMAGIPKEQLELMRNSRGIDAMLKFAAQQELHTENKDIANIAASHIRALSLQHHFEPAYQSAAKQLFDPNLPGNYKKYLGDFLRKLRGSQSQFSENFNPVYKKYLSALGIDASTADVRHIIDGYINLTHAGLLGFNPGPVVRNAFNIFQTGNRIGLKWVFQGIKKGLTTAGMEEAKAAGVISESIQELTNLRDFTTSRSLAATEKLAGVALKPYGSIENATRSAIFNGAKDRFLWAARQAGTNEEQLLRKAGMYRFHPVIRDGVMDLWRQGKLKDAATKFGQDAVHSTLWEYEKGYRPTAISGTAGRLFGMFGVWPANYLEYFRQMTMPEALGGIPMPRSEWGKWLAEFGVSNAAIVGAMGAAGASVGLGPEAAAHTIGWTGFGPLSYTGGPIFDVLKAGTQAPTAVMQAFIPQDPDKEFSDRIGAAVSPFINMATNVIPGKGVARAAYRSGGSFTNAVDRTLGTEYSGEPAASTKEEIFRMLTNTPKRAR